MPDSKISGLTSATTPLAGTEVLPIVQSGVTTQVSVANLTAGRSVDASTLTVTGNTYLATTSGNVGIGAVPTGYGKLEVYQSANNRILFSGASAYGNNAIAGINDVGAEVSMGIAGSPVAFYTNATERMRITSTGDVGIGTSSPGYRLDVYKAGAASISAARSDTQAVLRSEVGACAADLNVVSTYGEVRTATNHPLLFSTNATERMRIDSAGNLGIGTSSPGSKLEVVGAGVFKLDGAGSTTPLILRNNNTTSTQLVKIGFDSSGAIKASINAAVYGNDYMTFNVGSDTERMRLDASGNLGIATTSPDAKLRVNGTAKIGEGAASNTSKLMVNTVSGVAAGIQLFQDANESWIIQNPASTTALTFANSGTERMRITSTGNVGIGTTNPIVKLDIEGSGQTLARIKGGSGANQSSAFYVEKAGSAGTLFAIGDSAAILGGTPDTAVNIYTAGSVPLTMAVGGSEKVRITSAGDVGIGTSTPAVKLDVANGFVIIGANSANPGVGGNVRLRDDTGTSRWLSGILGAPGETAYSIYDLVAGAERMRITAAGAVGIGTSSPAGTLHVYGSGTTQAVLTSGDQTTTYLRFINTTNNAGYVGYTSDNLIFLTGSSERMRIDASGNVGIGTSSPGAKLEVSGSSNAAQIWLRSTDTTSARIRSYVNGVESGVIGFINGGGQFFETAGTERMRLDASGNLGLGVTPSAWAGYKPLQAGTGASFGGYAGDVLSFVGSNTYNDNTNWRYIVSGNAAARYQQSAGVHAWYTAPSGTAGNTISFTQAMTLDASGRLLIGTTTAGIGNNNATALSVANGTATVYQSIRASGGEELYLYSAAGSVGLYSYTNHPLVFGTNNAERLRITSAGNIHTPAGATTMTDGFIYIPAAAGAPSGVATAITGTVPLYYNSSANTLYAYNSSWQTISGGLSLLSTNANGVVYLNGSSQATTSSALQFNGTELAVGITPSAGVQFEAFATSLAQIRARTSTSGVDSRLASAATGTLGYVGTISNHDFALYANNTEQLRVNAASGYVTVPSGIVYSNLTTTTGSSIFSALTGVGYATVVQQYGAAATGTTDGVSNAGLGILNFFNLADGLIQKSGAYNLRFSTNGSVRMVLTSAGVLQMQPTGGEGGEINWINATGGTTGGTVDISTNDNFRVWTGNNNAVLQIGQLAGTGGSVRFFTANTERMRVTENGNITTNQPAQSAQNTAATLTIAQIRTRIITSNAAVTLTLPTGTTLDTYATNMPNDAAFEVTFIATAAAAITIAANGNTTVGSLTVAANTSGTYRFRKTAANTFTVYRL